MIRQDEEELLQLLRSIDAKLERFLQNQHSSSATTVVRECVLCGLQFEAGKGTARRYDAKFCTDEHRITFNSLKRSAPRKEPE